MVWIRDPGFGKNLFRIPDQGSKRHRIPDPGTGSATLNLKQYIDIKKKYDPIKKSAQSFFYKRVP